MTDLGTRRRRVLVAGCGDVGIRLGLRLHAEGHEVVALRRRPEGLPPVFRHVGADLTSPASLRQVPVDVDVVFFVPAADAFSDEAYRAVYVDGLRNLLAHLRAAGAPLDRVVYASSTAVYGQAAGEWVDERSATEPGGFAGRRLLEGESVLRESGLRGVILRLAGIYGPGRTRLIEQVRDGTATCPDGDPVYTNRIHSEDCAGALRHLMRLPEPDPVWIGSDHEPADRCAVLDWIADRLGVPAPRRVPAGARASARGTTSKRCRNAKLLGSGYVFRYPTYREGYAALLEPGGAPHA